MVDAPRRSPDATLHTIPMKLLVCSTGFLPATEFGGLPFSTFHLCSELVRQGADVRVVTTNCNGPAPLDVPTDRWTTYEQIPVWYARTSGGPFLFGASASKAISETIAQVDCVINSGTLWSHSGFLSWRAARRCRVPSLTYTRGLLDPWAFGFKAIRKRIYWNAIGKRILKDSTAVVALTDHEKTIIRRLGVTTRIEVIPNGAARDTESSTPRASLDARMPELGGRRYVLFMGRMHAIKGLDLLMPAIAKVLPQVPEVAFVLAGPIDPTYTRAFDDLLRAYPLRGHVVMPGAVSGALKAMLLEHAELFVLPSYGEGLPVAVLEALLVGCPAVITRQCHLPEVEQAGAGILIEPDVGQLVEALRTILCDETTRGVMAENARELAESRFQWERIGERTLALCREIVGSPRR